MPAPERRFANHIRVDITSRTSPAESSAFSRRLTAFSTSLTEFSRSLPVLMSVEDKALEYTPDISVPVTSSALPEEMTTVIALVGGPVNESDLLHLGYQHDRRTDASQVDHHCFAVSWIPGGEGMISRVQLHTDLTNLRTGSFRRSEREGEDIPGQLFKRVEFQDERGLTVNPFYSVGDEHGEQQRKLAHRGMVRLINQPIEAQLSIFEALLDVVKRTY